MKISEIFEKLVEYNKNKKNFPQKFKGFLKKTLFFFGKIKNVRLDSQDKEALIHLVGQVIFFGSMTNFAFFVIFSLPFTSYSWIGYGFAVYVIEKKLIKWCRAIRFK